MKKIDLFPSQSSSIFVGELSQDIIDRKIEWKKAEDIYQNQRFQAHVNCDPNSIVKGKLKNEWFLSALAAIAERPQLIERLIIKHDPANCEFHLKICKNGEWMNVIITDSFPTRDNLPIFSQCVDAELWVLLLEKAYAQLHGSYMLLNKGCTAEALIDLTGCPTITYDFSLNTGRKMLEDGVMWAKLKQHHEEGAILVSSVAYDEEMEDNGISYNIIGIKEESGQNLLHIRNMWNTFNWNGHWSNKSTQWTPHMREKLQPRLDVDDGTFWISFNDYVRNFQSVTICRVGRYHEARLRGKFVRSISATNEQVLSSWYYILVVEQEVEKMFISIHQEDERVLGAKENRSYLDIGIVIMKIGENEHKLYKFKDNALDRQSEIELELPTGSYLIIPRTTGCGMGRKHSADRVPLIENDQPNPLLISTLGDLFRRLDITMSQHIEFMEFKELFDQVGLDFTEPDFNKIADKYDSNRDFLKRQGFIAYFLDQIQAFGESKVFEWFETWGYDSQLYSYKERPFTLAFHTESDRLGITVRDAIQSGVAKSINNMIVESMGVKKSQGRVSLYSYYEPNSGIYTYGAQNITSKPVYATLDCTNHQGMIFSRPQGIATEKIEPNSFETLMSAM